MYINMKSNTLIKGFLSILLIVLSPSSYSADFTVPINSFNTTFTIILGPVSAPFTMWQLEQSYGTDAGPWVALGKKPVGNASVTVNQFGKYYYRARQYNPTYGTWGMTQPIEIFDTWIMHGPVTVGATALGTPQLFRSSDGDTSYDGIFNLQWNSPPAGSPVVTYYQWKEGNGSWTNVGTALSSAQITKSNGSFSYSVQACNATGCGASATYTIKVDLNVAPTINPSTLNSTDGKYNIGWTSGRANGKPFSHIWVYENNNPIWVYENNNPIWVYGSTVDGRATNNKNPLVHNKTIQGVYKYYVLACHSVTFGLTGGVTPIPNTGICVKSVEKSVTFASQNFQGPSYIVSLLSATTIDVPKVTARWAKVKGVTHYELQRNDKNILAQLTSSDIVEFEDVNVIVGETYIYKVRACINEICSGWVSATSLTVPPIIPVSLYSEYSSASVILKWDSSKSANRYELERNEVLIYSGSEINFTDVQVDPKVFYRVRACINTTCSKWRYDKHNTEYASVAGTNYVEGYAELESNGTITWTIRHIDESQVSLTFNYSAMVDQSLDVYVNDIKIDSLKVVKTSSFEVTNDVTTYGTLKKDVNKIKIVANGKIFINYLKINNFSFQKEIPKVWNAVVVALKANNRAELTKYLDPAVIENYNQVFDALGTNIIQVGNQLGSIEPMYVSETTAEYILTKKGDDGNNYVHIIKFIKDAEGKWKVNSL